MKRKNSKLHQDQERKFQNQMNFLKVNEESMILLASEFKIKLVKRGEKKKI